MPTASNWARSLQRGCRLAGHPRMRVYDCRHAAATTWLRAGAPLGEVARRLGHSVETLVSTYVGALDGDDLETNRRIDAACQASRGWLADRAKPVEPTADAEPASPHSPPTEHGKRRRNAVKQGQTGHAADLGSGPGQA